MAQHKILFVSRSPTVHQLGGSTTFVLNLLQVLVDGGASVTFLVTTGYGRSPSLGFRQRIPLPEGVELQVPGFARIGSWYLNVWSLRAWARAGVRLLSRLRRIDGLVAAVLHLFRGALIAEAWDLTPPTKAELRVCERAIEVYAAQTLIVNYAFWGPLFASAVAGPARRRVIVMHDLLSARVTRFLASGVPLDCARVVEQTELNWLNMADIVLAAQETEAEYVRTRSRAKVLVQPLIVQAKAATVRSEPTRCLFVGTNIHPNVTGITWFLEHVWPSVLLSNPLATLRIAGSVCSVLPSTHPRVTLLGIVPSLDAELAEAGLCIVPLLIGSGLKVKLLEALGCGKACVATSVGVQGLERWAKGAIEVADEPGAFAAAVLRVMSDEVFRQRLEEGALELVKAHFSPTSEAARAFNAAMFGSAR